jgi:glycosyltransferase 2 family protein
LIVSLVALIIVLLLAEPRKLLDALKMADYRLVLIGVALMTMWLVVRSVFWRTLLQEKATFSQVFFSVNEGYLLNNILPFRLGEIGRALILSYKANLSFLFVFSTILIERAFDVGISASLLLISVPFVVDASWAGQAALLSTVVVLFGLGLLYIVARNRDRLLVWYSIISQRWAVLQKIGSHHIAAFLSGLEVLTDGKRFLKAVFWASLNWGMALLQYYIIMRAFFPEGKFLWATFALGVVALGVAAPSSPGALGVYELAVVGALALFGVDPAAALAYALTTHLTQYLITTVLGSIGLFRDGLTLTGVFQRAQATSLDRV